MYLDSDTIHFCTFTVLKAHWKHKMSSSLKAKGKALNGFRPPTHRAWEKEYVCSQTKEQLIIFYVHVSR